MDTNHQNPTPQANIPTAQPVEDGSKILRNIFFVIAGVIAFYYFFKGSKESEFEKNVKNIDQAFGNTNSNTQPQLSKDTVLHLKIGDTSIIYLKPWEDVEFTGGGFEYMIHAQNARTWDTVGGNRPYIRPSEHTATFEVTALDSEITVSCSYKRIK